jgi:hypothetical protein
MASTKIAFYIYYLLIISPGIHVYVYYMVFAKLLQENYLINLFLDPVLVSDFIRESSRFYMCISGAAVDPVLVSDYII